ncbi:NAD(P)-dependent oxidoreductase [Sulfuriroseicoccus oceanibius]|uniref:NAD(P)-dependent oxidoreductase n=1 Tax=Sulfuriroseicoccus oceanibius TaxID=2707525 RepID=A0A6B3L7B6_9BACT|nr:NAD(P)-dependent oxidoreductase [Sulfuriroseicoccus oceanibius]QQL45104.1 NAD(P)-dependent oxidoreductase [Sulfuriroseicoccus oceanibius]
MNKESTKIGFVGVGRMGANMARHLVVDCGWEVTAIYDLDQAVAGELAAELGPEAVACSRLSDVTARADVIITVVTDDAAMRSIFAEGDEHLLVGAEGKVFINCATVSPEVHREVAGMAAKAGASTLEGCMASSISHARNGELYLMVAGDRDVFDAQRPLLDDLSADLRYCGEAGKAAEVKALVNMVMNMNTAALAEGLGLADALGLDLAMVTEVFSQTGAASRVLETDSDDMIGRDHECWFSAAHAAKDSGIAANLAAQQGLHLPVNEATLRQYQRLVEVGKGELDKSGIAELTFKGRHDDGEGGASFEI